MDERNSNDQFRDRKSRTSKKVRNIPPYIDPHLKFRMALALMGKEMAREYLEWLRSA